MTPVAGFALMCLGVVLMGLATSVISQTCDNLALKKNTIQSTTYTDSTGFAAVADLAVDGNTNSDFNGHSCTHTNLNEIGWWAVDLGQETSIARVRITNRNIGESRLRNFIIGLTNVSPWTSAPKAEQGSICKFYNGNPPASVSTDIVCCPGPASGRYLYIKQTETDSNTALTLCEVEAYIC